MECGTTALEHVGHRKYCCWGNGLLFKSCSHCHDLARRAWLIHILHRWIAHQGECNVLSVIWIKSWSSCMSHDCAGLRIHHNHSSAGSSRRFHSISNRLCSNPLHIAIDSKSNICARTSCDDLALRSRNFSSISTCKGVLAFSSCNR